MSDATPRPSVIEPGQPSAGQLLQAAREAQGMSLDILASIIKVSPSKLEALEADDLARLPDPNFNRALAMTVCRALKVDVAPILAAMPAAVATSLLTGKPGLNEPFRDFGNTVLTFESSSNHWRAPRVPRTLLAPLALLGLAALIYLVPDSVQWPWGLEANTHASADAASAPGVEVVASAPAPAPAPAAVLTAAPPQAAQASVAVLEVPSAPSAAGPASASAVPGVEALAIAAVAPASAVASAPVASGQVVLSATEVAWIEVRDSTDTRLFSRQLQAGERVAVSGQIPLKVVAGNAPTVSIQFNGKPVDLAAVTRQNVARIELK